MLNLNLPTDLMGILAAIFPAVLVGLAVAIATMTFVRHLKEANNRNVINAMPKYTVRALSTEEQLAAAEEIDESSIFLRLGQRILGDRYRTYLVTRMQSAGIRGKSALAAMITKKVTYGLLGGFFGVLFLSQGTLQWVAASVILAALGFFIPDILLISNADKREQQLDRDLPDAIDLLNLCVESGLSFENAISRVSVSLNGPVAEEFAALLYEIQLGKSRIEAMAALAERTKSPGFLRFLTALLQVDRLGAPVSGVLAEQAEEMRAIRRDKAREAGQKVTLKILMPLMLCFIPAMFIIVIGPAIVDLVEGLGALG